MEKTSSVETIARDIACCRCGYNLRGLGLDGRCPECGEAVEVSGAGRLLAVSDPKWRWRLRLGAGLHASGLIGFLLVLMNLFSGRVTGPSLMRCYVLMVVAVLLGATGAWLTTCAEPGGPYFDDARWLRRVIRGLAVLSWSGMVGYAAIQMGDWRDPRLVDRLLFWQNIAGVLGFGGSLLVTGLAIWHLSRLARRMDAGRLVLYGRLSAFSSAIMAAVIFGVACLMNYFVVYLRTNASWLFPWSMLILIAILLLWPATYQLIWRHRVGQAARPPN